MRALRSLGVGSPTGKSGHRGSGTDGMRTTGTPSWTDGPGEGAITIASWPSAARWSSTRSTERATPLTDGANDSAMIATRRPPWTVGRDVMPWS